MFYYRNNCNYMRILRKIHQSLSIRPSSCGFSTKAGRVLDAAYKPSVVEARHRSNVNKIPQPSSTSKPFTMIFPPPNVTGYIHLGHCLTATVQDVIARYKRNQGQEVIWVPGTDHAGIATQIVVEKVLHKEKGLTRHQLGREKFLDEVWRWKEQRSSQTKADLLRLGTTLNWDREYFTMNDAHSKAIRAAFIELFRLNLIYRKEALINWSCTLGSAISDIEVDNVEIPSPQAISVPGYSKRVMFGQIYEIAYKNDDGLEIVVATTRPETLLGDTALCVNPDDKRHIAFINDRVRHPFRDELIPVLADENIDPNFGTGAVKVTPAHDQSDFELSKTFNLKVLQVIDESGKICKGFPGYEGLHRFEAREKIVTELDQKGLLRAIKPHSMTIPVCSRSKDIIELLLRPQWFLSCKEMSDAALDVVKEGKLKIIPENFEQEWERWLNNCHDWCISRQLWWGHRIPAYECTDRQTGRVKWTAAHSVDDLKLDPDEWDVKQDEDVLDTWFSSALLPFSLFGWPDKNPQPYYPLNLMETGHDILFFWVARMAMLGLQLIDDVPFREVLLHGIICDAHGRKMSKSLGNVISPSHVINGTSFENLQNEAKEAQQSGVLSKSELEKSLKGQKKMFPDGIPECGADALRFTLLSHNIKTHFISFDVTECNTNKLFFNKIWQATRYTLGFSEKIGLKTLPIELNKENLSRFDSWILSRLGQTQKIVADSIETYNFHLATAAIKTFLYQNLCDVYLETTKRNQVADLKEGLVNCQVLSTCLSAGLQLIEPFTPHIAADLMEVVPKIYLDASELINLSFEAEVDEILGICLAVRQLKSEHSVTKRHNPVSIFETSDQRAKDLLELYKGDIQALTFSTDVLIDPAKDSLPSSSSVIKSTAGVLASFTVYSDKTIEIEAVKQAKEKKLAKLEAELGKLQKKIGSEDYQKFASEAIQNKHNERVKAIQIEIQNIRAI